MKATVFSIKDNRALKYLLLAIAMLSSAYVVGFSQNTIAHETFHEVRHAAGIPCH